MGKIQRWGTVLAFIVIIVCAYVGIKTIFIEDRDATVPSMTGMQLVDAVEALQREELLAKVDQIDSPEKPDTVISQSIPGGEKVAKGKVVLLRVSKGGAIMPLPDVRGLSFEEGVKRLSEAGFKVDSVLRVTDKLKPSGSIIAQNPAAPQQVPANCMVSLLVSTGSTGGSAFVRVPDLRGQNLEILKQVLEQSGLALGSVSEAPSLAVPVGTALSTRPKTGANVPAGTLVNVTLAKQPAPGEPTPDAPPANDQDPKKAAAVKTVIIKEAAPAQIPTKTQPEAEKKAAEPAKPAEVAPVEEKKPETVQPAAPQKTAKLRYQVPPLSKPLSLKIEMTDASGKRVLKDETAKGSEYISMNVPYSGQATITILLGGDFVWQDRFN